MIAAPPGHTFDSILGGAIKLIQPRRGYRFSVDTVLLARFATARSRDRVLELGAGCGVIAMIVAKLAKPREVTAVELRPSLMRLIDTNATLNGIRVTSVRADLRERSIDRFAPNSFDLVIANPPYRRTSSGRESPNPEPRAARSELNGALDDFIIAAARYARDGGRIAMVFTADRAVDLIATLRAHALEPKRIRFVHPRSERPASIILIEARKGGGVETIIEPPLVMYERPGIYSSEARLILSGA